MATFALQNGWSPLTISSLNGHLDVVKALIKAGANINQANKVSYTYLQCNCNTFTQNLHVYNIVASDKYIPQFMYIQCMTQATQLAGSGL